ncbi:MAG: tripartite tricarboxylate transporter substrate binding protein [Betaproteobacteria bacterium]|nr:tripartite tricarboxylate transporter substrate binding protein [Betaproteobacteria bacterium]
MAWFRLLACAFLSATAVAAQAQTFPTKPIRLVCPFPPGGAVDIASRAIAAELSKTIGQPVSVENKPGAGGNIGGVEVARSAPDGYTLLMTTSGINGINPVLYRKMPFDPNKDLTSVAALVSLSNVLVAHPSVKATNVAELLALLRSNPGKVTFASSGSGTSIHMSGEMFMHLTGTRMIHVPYKGSAPAITDLLGGQVQVMFDNIPSALPHIRSGKLRALATTGAQRDPALPDLPTIAEAGVNAYEAGVWFGLAAPAGTPADVIAKISTEAIKGTRSPEFVKRMTELGYVIMGLGPEQMTAMLKAEIERWTPVIKASGAVVE